MGKKFVTKTAADILSTVMEPREMIVENLIPQGICILAGHQKVGKSFLALELCISVASGQPVLGHETVRGECLYLGLEDTYRRLQNRLLLMNAEPTDSLHLAIAADRLGGGLENQIEGFHKEHPALRLVVIDVFQLVRKKATANYNAEYRELAGLRDLANRLGLCVMMVMHTRKSHDRDPLNNIYGAVDLSLAPTGFTFYPKITVAPVAVRYSAPGVKSRKSNFRFSLTLNRCDGWF